MKRNIDLSMLDDYADVKQHIKYPFVAVFQIENKKLIYVGTKHNFPNQRSLKTFYAINYCFDNFPIDFIVTECSHMHKLEDYQQEFGKPYMNELIYAPLLGQKQNIKYSFIDADEQDWFSDVMAADKKFVQIMQTFFVLSDAYIYKQRFKENFSIQSAIDNIASKFWKDTYPSFMNKEEFQNFWKQNFDFEITDSNLSDILSQHPDWNAPNIHGNIINRAWSCINKYSRDTRMLKGIAAALKQHNCVMATIGAGHFDSQRWVLESAFGIPKILCDFPRASRRDKII